MAPGETSPVLPTRGFTGDTSALVLLSSRNADAQIESHRKRAAHECEKAASKRQERLEAFREQLTSEQDKGFWDSVASIAKTVGAVAAVVAGVAGAAFTGGATLALAAAAVSLLSVASGGTLFLDKLGLSQESARGIALGLSVALAVASFGGSAGAAAAAQGGSQAASTTSTALEVGVKVTGEVASRTRTGAQVVDVVATARSGEAEADALEHEAEADLAGAHGEAASKLRREEIQMMREVAAMQRRILELARETEEAHQRGALAATRA